MYPRCLSWQPHLQASLGVTTLEDNLADRYPTEEEPRRALSFVEIGHPAGLGKDDTSRVPQTPARRILRGVFARRQSGIQTHTKAPAMLTGLRSKVSRGLSKSPPPSILVVPSKHMVRGHTSKSWTRNGITRTAGRFAQKKQNMVRRPSIHRVFAAASRSHARETCGSWEPPQGFRGGRRTYRIKTAKFVTFASKRRRSRIHGRRTPLEFRTHPTRTRSQPNLR